MGSLWLSQNFTYTSGYCLQSYLWSQYSRDFIVTCSKDKLSIGTEWDLKTTLTKIDNMVHGDRLELSQAQGLWVMVIFGWIKEIKISVRGSLPEILFTDRLRAVMTRAVGAHLNRSIYNNTLLTPAITYGNLVPRCLRAWVRGLVSPER